MNVDTASESSEWTDYSSVDSTLVDMLASCDRREDWQGILPSIPAEEREHCGWEGEGRDETESVQEEDDDMELVRESAHDERSAPVKVAVLNPLQNSSARSGSRVLPGADASHISERISGTQEIACDTSCLPETGRLPKEVLRVLNEAWNDAGGTVPDEAVITALSAHFGSESVPRIQRYFNDKARRNRLKNKREGVDGFVPLDVQRMVDVEKFLFLPNIEINSCLTLTCGLRHLLRLERVSGLIDIGAELYELFSSADGMAAIREYQKTYWSCLRVEILAMSSAKKAVAKLGSAFVELRLRLQFPESHAHHYFGNLCSTLAARCGCVEAGRALAVAVGKRQMSAVNERVCDYLRGHPLR